GLLPAAAVWLTRSLVDSLATGLTGDDWDAAGPVIRLGLGLAAVLLLLDLLAHAANWVRRVQAELLQDHLSGLIHAQSVAVDLAFYESPEFHDHLHRARAEALHRPIALLENLGSFVQNTITLVAMGVLLVPYGPWLPLALLMSTLPAFF